MGYWIPAFFAIVTIDWYYRARGRWTINPARESTLRSDAIVALVAFVVAFGAAVPFMDTSIIVGPVAKAWDGADVAYFVNFGVAAVIYGAYRIWRQRSSEQCPTRQSETLSSAKPLVPPRIVNLPAFQSLHTGLSLTRSMLAEAIAILQTDSSGSTWWKTQIPPAEISHSNIFLKRLKTAAGRL